jgi:fucose permease
MVFTALILSNFTGNVGQELSQVQIDDMAASLIFPYLGMALFIGLLGFAVKKSPLPELANQEEETSSSISEIKETLSHPNLAFGVIAIFVYVAVEVIAGDTIGTFALSLGVESYSVMTSYTMVCMVVGYILGIAFIPRFISQQKALSISAGFGVLLTLCILFVDTQSSIISSIFLVPFGGTQLPDVLLMIAFLGLANAIVWPAVFPLALSGMGKLTSTGSALLVMGIAGGAFGPMIWGLISGMSSFQMGYTVMLPCYLFILFYAVKGHKMKKVN